MASVIGICNSGLIKLGASTIMSLTEGTKNANLCNEQFAKLRDEVLRGHNWNFAIARAKLAQLSTAPAFQFDHAYQLPADWLRGVSVHDNEAGQGAVAYRIEGRTLLSDADTIYLRYVRRVTDPNEMDATFREALAWKIASDLAVPITQSSTVLNEMRDGFRTALIKARSVDAFEDFADEMPESDWITARN